MAIVERSFLAALDAAFQPAFVEQRPPRGRNVLAQRQAEPEAVMSDAKTQRQQLLNVSHAYSKIATACDLIREAVVLLRVERDGGLPVDTRHLAKTAESADIDREQLLIFIRRMP